MRLFDTLRQRVEPFVPTDGHVKLYVCGVTPYDTTHMGHAFTMMVFDVLTRYFEHRGHRVTYVQNVTDIDDSILGKAREINRPWDELGREQTEQYLADLKHLNARLPDHYVKATDQMPGMIEINQRLIDQGLAYESAGNVYFAVRQDPDYGKLSGLKLQDMLPIANQRGNHPTDPFKRDPLDFVLWQNSAPDEPSWPSPWGPGRPGWHIECSAMSMRYLGKQLDIHGGGSDLIFPHHESEIAQSEHFTGVKPFVRCWMHTAMVRYEGEKMSKSLGNLVMARRELADHTSDAIRLYLLSQHYRHPWDYELAGLDVIQHTSDRVREAATGHVKHGAGVGGDPRARFYAAMDDDFNTPKAVMVLCELADAILIGQGTADDQALLRELGGVLGLNFAHHPGSAGG